MIHRIWTYIWSVVQKTWEGWQADDGFLLSAAMAYYAAFSLFPLCLVLIAILGFVLEALAAGRQRPRRVPRTGQKGNQPLAGRPTPGPAGGRAGQCRAGRPAGGRDAASRRHRRFSPARLHVRPHFRHAELLEEDQLVGLRPPGALRSPLGLSHAPGRGRADAKLVRGQRLCFDRHPFPDRTSTGQRCRALDVGPVAHHRRDQLDPVAHHAGHQRRAYQPDLQDLAEGKSTVARCLRRRVARLAGLVPGTASAGDVPDRAELHGLRHCRLVHRGDDLGLLHQRHPFAPSLSRPSPSSPERKILSHPFEAWNVLTTANTLSTRFEKRSQAPALEKCFHSNTTQALSSLVEKVPNVAGQTSIFCRSVPGTSLSSMAKPR